MSTDRALAPAFGIGVHPLPVGHHTLEASAGTGKTHAIVGLATRYLAEGRCTAEELLVVTFSRSASRELRGRLLTRLSTSVDLLDAALAGRPLPDRIDDEDLHDALASDAHGDPAARLARLRTALADIDHASIATIHGFCDDLLRRLGDPALGTLLEDDGALATQIMGDVYVRMARHEPRLGDDLPYAPMKALPIIRAGMQHPRSALLPAASFDDEGGAKVWMAIAAGVEATKRKQAGRLHSHDDLLDRLAAQLTDGDRGTTVAELVGKRFRVGLVDEFQDTDPVQWRILTSLFADPGGADGRSLVLVGDPKQAIYAFRGADISTYLAARGDRPDATLQRNHRSDGPVVEACTTLFTGMPLGYSRIRVDPVIPTKPVRLDPPPVAPVALRVVDPDADIPTSRWGPLINKMREFVARDVAAHTVELLSAGTTVLEGDGDGQRRDLVPADIAVLVRTNAQARLVQTHLHEVGLPTVLNGVGNVLDTPAARDWLAVLRAVQQPWHAGSARLAALTDLIGWTPERVAAGTDEDVDGLHVMLHELAEHLGTHGVAAAHRWLDARTSFSPRLRSRPGGNRRLADLLHVTEVLHAEERSSAHGLGSLISWLESAMASAVDPPPDRLARRLEQTGDAVEIMTVHGAKGLQRRIVLVPFLWDGFGTMDDVIVFTDPHSRRRMADVGGSWPRRPDHAAHKEIAEQESEQEEMRLAYVAATRAMHHLVLWYGHAGRAKQSPMSTLLGRGTITASAAKAVRNATDLVDAHPGLFHRTVVTGWASRDRWTPPDHTPRVELSTFDRDIDHGWRRYSYSGLVAAGTADALAASGGVAGLSADAPRVVDDGVPTGPDALDDPVGTAGAHAGPEPVDEADLGAVVPLSVMPGGADVGSAVHAVFEHVTFDADDLPDQVERQLAVQARASSVDLTEVEGIVDAFVDVVHTPLGPAAAGLALRDIGRADRIDELEFELPVLPGDRADEAGRVLLTDLALLLRRHLPADDPLAGYADVLEEALGSVEIRGYLAGFIDLIARVPDADGGPDRFLVADYKTNRIGPAGVEELHVGHYSRASMAEAMMHHHYPVQALFYAVATHRYLRWRIADYDPAVHLAGVAYLFIRGMTGPDAPVQPDGTPYGVFTWTPPPALLDDLDRVLTDGLDAEDRT